MKLHKTYNLYKLIFDRTLGNNLDIDKIIFY